MGGEYESTENPEGSLEEDPPTAHDNLVTGTRTSISKLVNRYCHEAKASANAMVTVRVPINNPHFFYWAHRYRWDTKGPDREDRSCLEQVLGV